MAHSILSKTNTSNPPTKLVPVLRVVCCLSRLAIFFRTRGDIEADFAHCMSPSRTVGLVFRSKKGKEKEGRVGGEGVSMPSTHSPQPLLLEIGPLYLCTPLPLDRPTDRERPTALPFLPEKGSRGTPLLDSRHSDRHEKASGVSPNPDDDDASFPS